MDGLQFAATLSRTWGAERDQAIFDAIVAGDAPPLIWCPVETSYNGHNGVVFVASRAFRVGDENPLFVNVSHATCQRLCDHVRDDGSYSPEPVYGAVLPTARISDLRWQQAIVRLPPHTQPSNPSDRRARGYSPSMTDTDAMVRHSRDVAGSLCSVAEGDLAAPQGKDWTLTNRLENRPSKSAEYGLQHVSAPYQGVTPGVKVHQPGPSLAHLQGGPGQRFDVGIYTDYSMATAPVRARMLVDGDWRPTLEVAQDPDACGLVSSEGVLRVLRHPRVPGKVPVSPARPDRPQALFTRTLRVGHVGDDVRVWQGIVGAEQDGIFGPRTAAQTKAWQKAHGLVADGIVGPRTRAAAMRAMRTPPPRLPDDVVFDERELLDDIPFVPAVNYTPADRTAIRLVVVHSMEHPEKPSAAEGVANWFGGKHGRAPRASAHLCVDNDSAVECVKPKDVAWAAPGANHDGYQVEHAGYQRQTRAEWLDDYSESMLWLSAQAVRRLVVDPFGVPIRHLTDEQLAVGEAGFVDHHAATRVYRRSTHIDVGPGFPWDVYLRMVQEAG